MEGMAREMELRLLQLKIIDDNGTYNFTQPRLQVKINDVWINVPLVCEEE
jgi:hypothetical protein